MNNLEVLNLKLNNCLYKALFMIGLSFVFSFGFCSVDVFALEGPSIYSFTPAIDAYNYSPTGAYGGECEPSGQNVYYDSVKFGSYPQGEIKASVNSELYNKLNEYSNWVDDECEIDGVKYRRLSRTMATNKGFLYDEYMKTEDATKHNGETEHFLWEDDVTYHYFAYEPIVWRVLAVKDGIALLLSENALDDLQYSTVYTNVTWETSNIRSWLNGYGADKNTGSIDYSNKGFINKAFSADEQALISTTEVVNENNESWGSNGGNNTQDKIFIPSLSDMYGQYAVAYGFSSVLGCYDEARRCKVSDYAFARGTWTSVFDTYVNNCTWWLRSPGQTNKSGSNVARDGYVHKNYVDDITDTFRGVRVMLYIDTTKLQITTTSSPVSDAGKIQSVIAAYSGRLYTTNGVLGNLIFSNEAKKSETPKTTTNPDGSTTVSTDYTKETVKENDAPEINIKNNKKYKLNTKVTIYDKTGIKRIKINGKKIYKSKATSEQKFIFKLKKFKKYLKKDSKKEK